MSRLTWILVAMVWGLFGCSEGGGKKDASYEPSTADGGGQRVTDGQARASDDASAVVIRKVPATLVIHDTSRLTIGTTLPEFAYKGGKNEGTLSDHGDGTATVFFPAMGNEVTPLEVIPGGLGEVQIEPNDMTGQIDFCTGIVTMPFDAKFTPVILGQPRTQMHVVTDLTTETSMGMDHTLMGKRLNEGGDLKLVGIALVPKTDDITVDGLLGLPTDAQTDMDGTLTVDSGFPVCPASRTNELK